MSTISVNDLRAIDWRKGVVDTSNPSPGNIGEIIWSTIDSVGAVTLTNNTVKDVTSINLTPGDWDVNGILSITFIGLTGTVVQGGASALSGTLPTFAGGNGLAASALFFTPLTLALATNQMTNNFPSIRVSIDVPTTIYLVAQAGFTLGSIKAYGTIRARRMR